MNDMTQKETSGDKEYRKNDNNILNELFDSFNQEQTKHDTTNSGTGSSENEGKRGPDTWEEDQDMDLNHTSRGGNDEANHTAGSSGHDVNSGDDETEQPSPAGLTETERLKKDLSESNDKYLRLAAEFDNFRKRTMRERSEMLKTAGKDVLVAVIPVIDDFERAERSIQQATDLGAVKEGLALISSKFKKVLNQQGLKEMISVGEPFDTDKHEAITNVPAPSPDLKGKVLDETEKGYMIGDKVIRFAKVIVGQ